MTKIREIEIASWATFVSHIEELTEGLSEVAWFRGQAQAWQLRPHLLRHLWRGGITDARTALIIEDRATREFKRAAHFYLPVARLDQLRDAQEKGIEGHSFGLAAWWTVMRHHRAPTRLLDWTLSAYVAAYFASESPLDPPTKPPPPGIVWVLDFGALRAWMDERYAKDGATRIIDDLLRSETGPDDLLPIFHEMPTERMLAQQGCFTICRNVLGDHGEIIERAVPAALAALLIPDRIKPDFRRQLNKMNLTAHSLFRELDGLGRHTEETVAIMVDARGAPPDDPRLTANQE